MPESSSARSEWPLLLTACTDLPPSEVRTRVSKLVGPQIQWDILLTLAERHGVQPLLAKTLSSVADHVPADVMGRLRQSYQANLHKSLLLSRELIRILEVLSSAGIDVMPYKGLVLAEAVYGDIALRQAGDIDLLIRANDLKRIREALCQLGYAPHLSLSDVEEHFYLKSGYELAFDGAAGKNLLEVQWAVQPRFYAVDVDMAGMFQRATKVTAAGAEVTSPCTEDLFLLLALHAAKHVWGRLIWLCDLARISVLPGLDWEQIGTQARELGIARILRVTFLLSQSLLGSSIPGAADEALPRDPGAQALTSEIEHHICAEKTYEVESVSYFRLMLRLRERRRDRLRFLTRLAFTPGPSEWAAVRLPQPLFPLYRIVRVARLALRTVGRRGAPSPVE